MEKKKSDQSSDSDLYVVNPKLEKLEFDPNLRYQRASRRGKSIPRLNYRQQELTPNYLKQPELAPALAQSQQSLKAAKQFAPAMLLLGAVSGGLFLLASFAPFPLLITHWAQTLVDKFNYQEVSINNRSKIAMQHKINSSGAPVSKYKLVEDYNSVSDKLKTSLEQQGFEVETNDQQRLTKFKYKNYDDLSGTRLLEATKTDLDLMMALNRATASRYATFSDAVWQQNAQNQQINKNGLGGSSQEDISVEELQKNELDYTKLDQDQYRFNSNSPEATDDNQDSLAIFNSVSQNLNQLNQTADKLNEEQITPDNHQFDNLVLVEPNFVTNNTVCGALQTSTFQKDYNKSLQRDQLTKLTSAFLSDADQIKAGKASSTKTEYWGKRLNSGQNYIDATGQATTTESASDSYAYQWVAYGDTGNLDLVAQKYVVGANQTNSRVLKTIKDFSETLTGKAALGLCKVSDFTKTNFGEFFSLIPSLLSRFLLGGAFGSDINQILDQNTTKTLTNSTLSAMTGRRVSPGTTGEDLGNALIAGAGYLLGRQASMRGNPILTKTQAVAYLAEQRTLVAQRNQYDRQQRSPFDTTSPNTMLGSLMLNLAPLARSTSANSFLGAIFRISNQSLASIAPLSQTKAMAQDLDSFAYCEDPDVLAFNQALANGQEVAVDPLCNIHYGVDVKADDNPLPKIVDQLEASGQIKASSCDANGRNCALEPTDEFKTYTDQCVNQNPLETSAKLADKSLCLATNDQKTLFANFITDSQLENMQSDSPVMATNTSGAATDSNPTTNTSATSSTSAATLSEAQNSGWGGFSNGKIPSDKLTAVSFMPNHRLHADAAAAITTLNTAYKAKFGSNIVMTDSYRSYQAQVICRQNKGSICAVPGTSNHGWGLAVDLAGGINNYQSEQYKWMTANAPTYGFVNPAWARQGGSNPEPWHWEYARPVK